MAPDDDAVDGEPPDEPLALLGNLEVEPTSDLPGRVRRGIERRFLSRDLAIFYCTSVATWPWSGYRWLSSRPLRREASAAGERGTLMTAA
jgi:hypothetical protein